MSWSVKKGLKKGLQKSKSWAGIVAAVNCPFYSIQLGPLQNILKYWKVFLAIALGIFGGDVSGVDFRFRLIPLYFYYI
jgi:hypothetical protein